MIEKIAVTDIVKIAEKAGEKVLEIYHSREINWEVEAKADDSPPNHCRP